jgi:hypothetical protein
MSNLIETGVEGHASGRPGECPMNPERSADRSQIRDQPGDPEPEGQRT